MLKKLIASVLAVSLLAPVASFAGYDADDRIEDEIRADANYYSNLQKARTILQSHGYTRIKDFDADAHRGQKTIEVTAYKNGQKYDVRLAYPSLEIIEQKLDD